MKTPNILTILRFTLGISTLGLTGRWWQKATDNFTDWNRSKPEEVTQKEVLSEEQLQHYTAESKIRFVDVIQSYTQRDKQVTLTAEELKFAQGKIETYKKLAESRTASGFYGVALKDEATNKIILALAGGDFSTGFGEFINDLDDMFMSTSGGPISHLPDAIKFAEEVQQQFGKIDIVAGHSTGAYLTLYLAGSGKCPGAKCYVYDGPNATHSLIDNCAELGHITKAQVINNLRNNCLTTSITPNSYNSLGAPAGISLIAQNNPSPFFVLVPRLHIYADDILLPALEQTKTLVQRTDNSPSGGPAILTTVLLLTTALAFKPELQKALKSSSAQIT